MKGILIKIHDLTCPAWLLGLKKVQKFCAGCRISLAAKGRK